MNKLKAILVDDEHDNNTALRLKLEMVCPEVEVIQEFTNPTQLLLDKTSHDIADVLFLDVEMPILNGFQLLDMLKARQFEVIMVTVYADYAMQALKAEALDYLLKPVEYDELRKAVNKIHTRKDRFQKMQWSILKSPSSTNKILLRSASEAHYIDLEDIICIHAENNYCQFHLKDGRKILISKTLKDYDEQFQEYGFFFRVHKSSLINLHHVARLIKSDNLTVELSNKEKVDVSLRKRNRFLQLLDEGWNKMV